LAKLPLTLAVLAGVLSYGALVFGLRVLGPEEWQFVRRLRGPAPSAKGGQA
jgi:hypothetical protein